MKRDDTKKNFTSLSGNDLQTVRLHYPSFPCIIAIVPVSRLLNLMRYSSVLNANIRFFCSENRNFTWKGQTMTVSSEVFERIAKAAVASRAASEKLFHGPQKVIIKGKVYYSQTISFYENDEFDYALGCATIFFDEEGVPVGLKDIYDFNEAKHRDTNAESDTTFMAKFEKANLAKSYAILYGINDYDLHDWCVSYHIVMYHSIILLSVTSVLYHRRTSDTDYQLL